MNSPVGCLRLVAGDRGLAAILWPDDDPKRVQVREYSRDDQHPVLLEAERQLNEYFAGRRKSFSLALDPMGTDFQKKVWKAPEAIPYGKTTTYTDIARQIGKDSAVRAVGAAIGRNPLSLLMPCHRVIGTSGELTGFVGGLEAKACLLSLEGATTKRRKTDKQQLTMALAG